RKEPTAGATPTGKFSPKRGRRSSGNLSGKHGRFWRKKATAKDAKSAKEMRGVLNRDDTTGTTKKWGMVEPPMNADKRGSETICVHWRLSAVPHSLYFLGVLGGSTPN